MAVAGTLTLSATAQTTSTKPDTDEARLKKEITVDRSIVPQLREAKRLNLAPAVVLPTAKSGQLDYSARTVTARVPALFSVLSPAAYDDSIPTDNSRGYVMAGYGPTLDALVSAGYNVINTSSTQLGAWIQFDGTFFHHKLEDMNPSYETSPTTGGPDFNLLFRRNTFTGGVSLSQAIGKSSALDLDLTYTFDKYNSPELTYDYLSAISPGPIAVNTIRKHVNRFDGKATFSSTVNDLRYSIGAKYNIFAFGNNPSVTAADKQNVYEIGGVLRTNPDDESQAMLSVSYTGIHDSNYPIDFTTGEIKYKESYNQGLGTIMPTYRYESGKFVADLGVRLDLTVNSGKAFHIAPNVKVSWLPSDAFTLWAKASGGEVQNTLASLYSFTPYIASDICYRNSHVPVTLDAGFMVGPFKSAYVKVFGGWAKANDWLMPSYYKNGIGMRQIDIDGWHAGIALGYSYRRIADIEVSAEIAPQDEDKGYYLWRDRAKRVINADLTLRPIEPLEVNLGWELRGGRAVYTNEQTRIINQWHFDDYSTLSNVSASGRWTFNPMVSVFLNIENILNHKNVNYLGEGGRGIHGMAGFSLKF